MTDFRCAGASRDDDEPLAGTAPTDTELWFVEHAGPWAAKAVEESRLPDPVKAHLAGLAGVRVQLIRRHGGESGPGVRLFRAVATRGGFDMTTAHVRHAADIPGIRGADWAPYDGLLWLVCTNGRRDRCCAEVGRPVAAALAARWPVETWETTHLGGHRFSGTLLALPGGHTLGRLDPESAVEACTRIERGGVPLEVSRGRAGRSPEEQVRELHVLAGGDPDVDVVAEPGPARRQSCADLKEKPTTRFVVRTP